MPGLGHLDQPRQTERAARHVPNQTLDSGAIAGGQVHRLVHAGTAVRPTPHVLDHFRLDLLLGQVNQAFQNNGAAPDTITHSGSGPKSVEGGDFMETTEIRLPVTLRLVAEETSQRKKLRQFGKQSFDALLHRPLVRRHHDIGVRRGFVGGRNAGEILDLAMVGGGVAAGFVATAADRLRSNPHAFA